MGRKPKPGSDSRWIPGEIIKLVDALKTGDTAIATREFALWLARQEGLKEPLDSENKPDVN